MRVRSPAGIARFDSAAAMAQAVGAFLHGRDLESLSGSPLLDSAMPTINRLPRRAREWLYTIGGMTEAVGPGALHKLDFDRIAGWIADLMPARNYPAVFVGSSNGALVHLAPGIAASAMNLSACWSTVSCCSIPIARCV